MIALLLQRKRKEEEKADLRKQLKSLDDDIIKMRLMVQAIEDMQREAPDSYWKVESIKGKKNWFR